MANASYAQGAVSVGTTATKVCTVPAENDDILVYCAAAGVVFGGPTVTATGANMGVTAPATTLTHIPSVGGTVHDLYAIVATTATVVNFFYPEV
jgi:hypothetical protein